MQLLRLMEIVLVLQSVKFTGERRLYHVGVDQE
jgi:hypothetical protein